MPTIVRSERDECVVLVRASRQDGISEWSFGEATIVLMKDTGRKNKWDKPIYEAPDGVSGNYQVTPKQASYVYAMAEKRAKDRVIIKLAGLHGAYSEEEADDFKAGNADKATTQQPAKEPANDKVDSAMVYVTKARDHVRCLSTAAAIEQWWMAEASVRQAHGIVKGDANYAALGQVCADQKRLLSQEKAA